MARIIRELSTESFVEEKQRETELVVYARLENFDYLDGLKTYRDIIQLQAPFGTSQYCRCRKENYVKDGVQTNEQPNYTFTVKAGGKKSKSLSIKSEYNFVVDEEFYNNFLETSDSRQIKKRYTFRLHNFPMQATVCGVKDQTVIVPELLYEFDVFEKENGYRSQWVKIDIELDSAFKFLTEKYKQVDDLALVVSFKQLPFLLRDGFIEKYADPTQKKMLDELWRFDFKEFLTPKRQRGG